MSTCTKPTMDSSEGHPGVAVGTCTLRGGQRRGEHPGESTQGPEEANGGQKGAPHEVGEGSARPPAVGPELGISGIRDVGLVGRPSQAGGRVLLARLVWPLSVAIVSLSQIKIDGNTHPISQGEGNIPSHCEPPPLLFTGHRSSSPSPSRSPAGAKSRPAGPFPSTCPGFAGQDTHAAGRALPVGRGEGWAW